jgi:D-methionine transport system substrate-binding protein
MKKTTLLVTSLLLVGQILLAACSTPASSISSNASSSNVSRVKIGVIGTKHELWDRVKENLASENIEIELVEFTEYTPVNQALYDGDLDLNAFQHYIYFDQFNETHDNKLVSMGKTFLSPIGLYSESYTSASEIKEGDPIAIPDDPTNLGRSLKLLESAGLIKLKDSGNLMPTQQDIAENPLNLVITELDAAQTARALVDVGASVINTDLAVDAGFSPSDDSIFLEPVTEASQPYINLIAAHVDQKDNEVYKKIVAAYQTQEIGELMIEVYKGAQFPAWEGYIQK